MQVDRHDIALRDVRDGELIVSYNHVERGPTSTAAYHCSDRLPLACLVLFDGGVVDADELTHEQRQWIEYEGERIVFEEVAE